MGIILSALAAAGDSGVQSMNQNIEQQNRSDLMKQQSDLEMNKAKTLAQFQNDLQNAPMKRAAALLQSVSGQDAPQQSTSPIAAPAPAQPNETPVSNATGNPLVDSVAKREGLSPTQAQVMSALLHQESNNGKNAVTSTDGAIGAGQIMPATFAQYARKGESIGNPADNLAVMARIVKDLGARSGDDPAKIATGYFSGPGNMNLADDAKTDWINDHADGNGKRVSSYVKDVLGRLASAGASQVSGSDQGGAATDTTTVASGSAPTAAPSGSSQQSNMLQLAYQKALATGDLQAAAALKAMIPDKTIKLGDGETLIDAATNRPIFSNTGKADRQDKQLAAQMALEDKKEANRNRIEAMRNDPLGLNGDTTVAQPVGGSLGASNATAQFGSAAQAIRDGLHGDELLAALPPKVVEQVKALSEGRQAFPTGFALKAPYMRDLLTLVSQYDPSFDAVNFNKRNQTAVAFSKGKQADAVRAANQTIAHMGSLYDTIDSLNNFNGAATPLNYIVNPIESAFGDARQGTFKMQAQAVASELRKVFSGSGGGSLQELKSWEESLPVNASQNQQKTYLQMGSHLLQGAIDALDNQYQQGMGTVANRMPLISPKAQSMLNKIQGNSDSMQAAATPAQGGSLTYDPSTGGFH